MTRPAAIAAIVLVLTGLSIALLRPPGARADGDPASDVLVGQDVFPPYEAMSRTVEDEYYAVVAVARSHGYPIKVALIGSRSDLGVIPSVFGRPQAYASFLSSELTGVWNGPVLVVMRHGFGLAAAGKALSRSALAQVGIPSGTDGLGRAAIAAVRALAGAAGHPLPASITAVSPSRGASAATVRSSLIAIAILCALAAAGIAFGLRARTRAG